MRRILYLCVSICLLACLAFPAYGAEDEDWLLNAVGGETADVAVEAAEEVAAAPEAAVEAPEEPAEGSDSTRISDILVDPINQWSVYDIMINAIKQETDMEERAKMMHLAEDTLMATYCVIPIYYYNDVYLQKSYVNGIYNNPYAIKYFMYATKSDGSDTLNLYLSEEPYDLDPALVSSIDCAVLAANSFSGLYMYNDEGATVPACAEGYTVSEDGLTYTVTLKKDLKWSDGTPLTASDFEYSWKRAVDPSTMSVYEYMFNGFDGYETGNLNVTAVDDTTLVFVLKYPCAYVEDLMAFQTFYPVPKAWVEAYATADDPGAWCREAGFPSNGAFVCTEWEHEKSMTYEKNPYWFDADNVKISKLNYMLSADMEEIYSAYENGSLDLTDSVPSDKIAQLIATSDAEFHTSIELGTYYVAFNANSKLFEGKTYEQAAAMRQAVSMLIDRKYICEDITQGGQIASTTFIPVGMADGNGGIFHRSVNDGYYDAYAINNDFEGTVDKAIELLKFAGYEFDDTGMLSADTPLTIDFLTNESSGNVAIAEEIKEDLAVVGIVLNINTKDWRTFMDERTSGNFDIAREGWIADYNDPINMLELFTTTSPNNDCQFGRY